MIKNLDVWQRWKKDKVNICVSELNCGIHRKKYMNLLVWHHRRYTTVHKLPERTGQVRRRTQGLMCQTSSEASLLKESGLLSKYYRVTNGPHLNSLLRSLCYIAGLRKKVAIQWMNGSQWLICCPKHIIHPMLRLRIVLYGYNLKAEIGFQTVIYCIACVLLRGFGFALYLCIKWKKKKSAVS